MAYELTILEKPGYLHAKVTGDNTAESVRGYTADLYEACRQRKCPVILVEENLRGPSLSVMEIYNIVVAGSQKTWPHVRQIAYVDVNPEHQRGQMRFAETVAINRGVNIRLFGAIADAEKWLLETSQGAEA